MGEFNYKLITVKREEIPPPTEEDIEFMFLWNLRLFLFIINNEEALSSL